MVDQKTTFCRICEPSCSMIASFGDDRHIKSLLPDLDHPSGGRACHKGLSFLDVHNDPDRLDWPLRRRNSRGESRGVFERTDWDTALEDVAARLNALRSEYGPNAVAIYYGNPFGVANGTALSIVDAFREAMGTQMIFSANTQDTQNKLLGSAEIYGSPMSGFVPDLYNSDFLLCIGGNPRVSRWTFLSVPNDDLAALKGIRQRGGTVRFINPRRTESSTAEIGTTMLIRPGTDAYFLAALLNEIDRRDGFDADRIAAYGKHVDELRNFISEYTPARVEAVTGIAASDIAQVAAEILAAPSAAVYMATGLNQSRQGTVCHWLIEMINFLTGNLGRIGGTFKPSALIEHYAPIAATTQVRTSIGSFEMPDPMGLAALPAASLSQLIDSGDIRALLVLGGNPLLSVGGEDEMRAAFAKLDLLVSVDIFRQATAELSDYVLPSTDWLEHADVNMLGNGYQLFPYVQYTDAMVAPREERRNGWWIISRLSQAMGLPSGLDAAPTATDGDMVIAGMLAAGGLTVEGMRSLPHQTHIIEQGPGDALFEKCLKHPDGRIDCCPDAFRRTGLLDRFHAIFDELSNEPAGQLKLVSLRTGYMHNSWLANSAKLRGGE